MLAGGLTWLVVTESRSSVVEDGIAQHLYSTDALANEDRSRVSQHRLGAIAVASAGATAAIVGAILLITAPPSANQSLPHARSTSTTGPHSAHALAAAARAPAATVSPWASGDGAGLLISGRF